MYQIVPAAQSSERESVWPPLGKPAVFKVERDTWVSGVDEERNGNNGGAAKLKLKGRQELILFDINPQALKGKIVSGALLHFRSSTPLKAPFTRLGVSSLASQWKEGNSKDYYPQKGSACFMQAEYQKKNWAYPGSTILDVIFGKGNTVWRFAESSRPDQTGWQSCAVDPKVISARIGGISHGFALSDEVGNTWSLKNKKFQYTYFPNRFCYSSETKKNAPWLEIWVNGEDLIPPEPVSFLWADTENMPAGEALVSWKTPADSGGSKTVGFFVAYLIGDQKKEIPRYLIPMAGRTGEIVKMHIQDLPFVSGQTIKLEIKPVDGAGNIGKSYFKSIQLASGLKSVYIPELKIKAFAPNIDLPKIGDLKIAVVDMLDKIDPVSGELIPDHDKGYKGGNHIFSAEKKLIRLFGARNEHVAFQINFQGRQKDISIEYNFANNPNLKTKMYEFGYVNLKQPKSYYSKSLPDPLVPLKNPFSIPSTAGKVSVAGQTNHSLVLELYIPHNEKAGRKIGKVVIRSSEGVLKLDVDLTVWNFTLPDKLSFVPEMNAYSKVSPFRGYDYYRLAHEHRTCINRLPYGWDGKPDFAPIWKNNRFDWQKWDKHVGPLLDGTAFNDLPRKGEPVDVMYLPFNENWPVNLFEHFQPSYWADEAFTADYSSRLKKAFALFVEHCNQSRWQDTNFQFYLNNKIYYRRKNADSSAPWLFDEPVNTQDFWALRWYGLLWKKAVLPVKGRAKVWYRGDISYSQYERDMLKGIMDIQYLGNNNAQKIRMKRDESILWGKSCFSEYGSANAINKSNVQPNLWCISAWANGAEGVLPWQTIGNEDSWKTARATSLFYPTNKGPVPSVRLKAFRRGQQDVEYLTLFSYCYKLPKDTLAGWLKKNFGLKKNELISSAKDTKPIELWKIRCRLGERISDLAPPYQRSYSKRKSPVLIPENMSKDFYAKPSPFVESYKPDCDQFE